MSRFDQFICRLGGYCPDTAGKTPDHDQLRTRASAMLVLIPVFVAGGGAGITLYSVNQAIVPAVVVGLVWAFSILLLDRALVAGFKPGSRNVFLYAAPRLLLAFLASLVFSHAYLLVIFSGAIDTNTEKDRREEANNVRSAYDQKIESISQANDPEKADLQARIEELSRDIATVSLGIKETQQELSKGNAIVQAETRSGYGPRAKEKHAVFVAPFQAQLQSQQANLASLQAARSEAMRSLQELSRPSRHLQTLQNSQAEMINTILRSTRTDPLSRYRSLHEIIKTDVTARVATWAVCLLLLLLELAPLLQKLLSGETCYNRQVALKVDNHIRDCINSTKAHARISEETQLRIAQSHEYAVATTSMLNDRNTIHSIKSEKSRHHEPDRYYDEILEALTNSDILGNQFEPSPDSDFFPSTSPRPNGSRDL